MPPITWVDLLKHYYSSSHDAFIWVLVSCVFLDIITGLIKAAVNRRLNSSIGLKGIGKHLVVLLAGLIVYPFMTFLGFEEVAMGMISFAIVTYLISLLENFSELGFPFPRFVKNRLERLRDSLDEKD